MKKLNFLCNWKVTWCDTVTLCLYISILHSSKFSLISPELAATGVLTNFGGHFHCGFAANQALTEESITSSNSLLPTFGPLMRICIVGCWPCHSSSYFEALSWSVLKNWHPFPVIHLRLEEKSLPLPPLQPGPSWTLASGGTNQLKWLGLLPPGGFFNFLRQLILPFCQVVLEYLPLIHQLPFVAVFIKELLSQKFHWCTAIIPKSQLAPF